jgi:hypothetical protein
MGLDLSQAGIVDDAKLQKRAKSIYGLLDDLKCRLQEDLGVEEMPSPSSQPPALAELNVEQLGNRELGGLYTQYVAHAVFLNGRLAEINALERAAKGNLKRTIAEIKNELRSKGVKEAEVVARVEVHPVYEEFAIEALKLFMMKELVEAYQKAYKDMAAALSRNITLRELEFEQIRREDNIQKSRAASTPQRVAGRGKRFGRG